jgi:hypothetical protein
VDLQELLETYNIGIDSDARNREMVEKTAARVGFKLPGADASSSAAAAQQDSSAGSIPQQALGQGHVQQQSQQQALHNAAGGSSSGSTNGSSSSRCTSSSQREHLHGQPASQLQQEHQASVAAG